MLRPTNHGTAGTCTSDRRHAGDDDILVAQVGPHSIVFDQVHEAGQNDSVVSARCLICITIGEVDETLGDAGGILEENRASLVTI